MKKYYFTPALLTIAALLSACSSLPTNTSLLEQTRSDYVAAQTSSNVSTYASLEMKQASEAMGRANTAADHSESSEKVDQLAYVAKQKIALTQEVAKQKAAEAASVASAKERDQMRLDQRTMEANREKANAEQAKMNAAMSQSEAAESQRKAQLAQADAAASQRRTQDAQADAAESQRKTQDAQARSAQLEAELSDLAAKKTERGMVITLGDVLFGTGKSNLSPAGIRTAQKLATVLQKNPERTVLIEGFTDSTGSRPSNQDLSERRADAVRTALQEMGVANTRIATRGYADAHPVASNNNAQDRQMNRRVEIILSDANGKVLQR
jgi:outer membrane protein OmpA-like peptidoglycan-associated protein